MAATPSTTATPAVQVRFPCPSSRTRRQSSSPTTLGTPIRKRRSVCPFLNPHSHHPFWKTVLNEFVQQNAIRPKQWTSPTSSRDAVLVVPLNPSGTHQEPDDEEVLFPARRWLVIYSISRWGSWDYSVCCCLGGEHCMIAVDRCN
jgi:hypothetical protein